MLRAAPGAFAEQGRDFPDCRGHARQARMEADRTAAPGCFRTVLLPDFVLASFLWSEPCIQARRLRA
ncbi:MAG: hypothetical protein DBY37_05110 [Desulfovibrionaceae bacterium]|nr:MAG: hypothetical protein DBY37_05110 [Desulfovibrionaceae bacterium]